MVRLEITGKCVGCPYLRVDVMCLTEIDVATVDAVDCVRKDFCDRLEAWLRTQATIPKPEDEEVDG